MYKKIFDDLNLFPDVPEQDQLLVYQGFRSIYFHDHLSRFFRVSKPTEMFPKEVPFFKTKNYLTANPSARTQKVQASQKHRQAYYNRRLALFELDLESLTEEEWEELRSLMERFSYNPLEELGLDENTLKVVNNRNKGRVVDFMFSNSTFNDNKKFVKRNWNEFLGWASAEFAYREGASNFFLFKPSALSKKWTQTFYKALSLFGNKFVWEGLRNQMENSQSLLHKLNIPRLLPVFYTYKRARWENKNVHTRTGARLRYRETVNYDSYKQWVEGLVSFFRSYTFFDEAALKASKMKFEKIEGFNPETYLPKSFAEAICFFSVYGPPSRKSTDITKNWLFLFVFLSGFYIDHSKQTIGGFGFELFRRRLYATHALIDFNSKAVEAMKHESFHSWNRHKNEWLIVYGFRYVYLCIEYYIRWVYYFIIQVTVQLFYYWRDKVVMRYYRVLGWYEYHESYFSLITDIITDIQLEVTPFFSNNKLSFVWYYCPVWLEAALLTIYVIYSEMSIGSSAWTHVKTMTDIDQEDPYDSAYYLDEVMDQYYDLAIDFFVDYILYYYEMLFKPVIDLFVVLPIWVVMEFFSRLYLSVNGFRQNLWHAILTKGDDPITGKVRGRWWKIPLILLRWSFYWILALHLLWFFLFYVNFEAVAFVLQPYSPMILNTVELQFMYVILVFLFVIRVCGPTFLVSMIKEDWGSFEWFGFAYFSFNWMWVAPVKSIPSAHFNSAFWESYAIWEDRGQGDFDLEGDTHAIMDLVEVMGWADHRQATAHFAMDELGGGFKDYPHPDYLKNPPSMREQFLDAIAEEESEEFIPSYWWGKSFLNDRGEDFVTAYARNYHNRLDSMHKEWHNPNFERPEWDPQVKRFEPLTTIHGVAWEVDEVKVGDEMLFEYKPIYYELKYTPPVQPVAKVSPPDDFVREKRFRRR
jgi:hypothetical protein